MLDLTLIALVFMCGYALGYLNKGITIIHKSHNEEIKEYNESVIDELPMSVRDYYDHKRSN